MSLLWPRSLFGLTSIFKSSLRFLSSKTRLRSQVLLDRNVWIFTSLKCIIFWAQKTFKFLDQLNRGRGLAKIFTFWMFFNRFSKFECFCIARLRVSFYLRNDDHLLTKVKSSKLFLHPWFVLFHYIGKKYESMKEKWFLWCHVARNFFLKDF